MRKSPGSPRRGAAVRSELGTPPEVYPMANKPYTVTVALDTERQIRFQHAMELENQRLGGEISKSVFMRRLIDKALDDPRPTFDQGWLEGYRAGYAAIMRVFKAVSIAIESGQEIPGLDIGMRYRDAREALDVDGGDGG